MTYVCVSEKLNKVLIELLAVKYLQFTRSSISLLLNHRRPYVLA